MLAAGAVANADTVNVVEDPADFMHLKGIFEMNGNTVGNAVTAINVNGLNSNTNQVRLDLEVLAAKGASPLEQVAICLYDSNVISAASLGTECGSGLSDPKNSGSSKTAGQNPHSAIHMVFLANPTTPATPAIVSGAPAIPGVSQSAYEHFVASLQADLWASKGALADTLNLQTIGSNAVWHLEFRLAPRMLAHHTNTWKIRVLATYADQTQVQLLDDTNYEINFFGSMFTYTSVGRNERPVVDYGDLMAGESSLQTGIQSGAYNANSIVDVTLSADAFSKGGVDLAFGTNGTPGNGQVSLECYATTAGTPVFLQDSTAIDLFLNQPANSQPTGDRNAWNQIAAPSHNCELHYGDGADTGTYTNVMTLGVKESN